MFYRIYHFFICDRECGIDYYYGGCFANTSEALRFIRENCEVGNLIFTEAIDFVWVDNFEELDTFHYQFIDWL